MSMGTTLRESFASTGEGTLLPSALKLPKVKSHPKVKRKRVKRKERRRKRKSKKKAKKR